MPGAEYRRSSTDTYEKARTEYLHAIHPYSHSITPAHMSRSRGGTPRRRTFPRERRLSLVVDCVTDGVVDFEPLETVSLKGVVEPVALFLADRAASQRSSSPP
jgi:hypothetical protein